LIAADDIRRLHLGHFTAPEGHPLAPSKVVVDAFAIRHPQGLVLFDTGIGEGDPEAEELLRPIRWPLRKTLAGAGVDLDDVTLVANCHLHFDHSGGNHLFPATPIFAQALEYEAVREPDYTLPDVVADFPGANFQLLEGEAEILPGIRIVPTPGHTAGHQSLVVHTDRGPVVLAGQACDSTSDYGRAHFAWRLEADGSDEAVTYPAWIGRIMEFDPWRVLFAHDVTVWERPPS
jgi:N-acyl homoserine lactone hydrolase